MNTRRRRFAVVIVAMVCLSMLGGAVLCGAVEASNSAASTIALHEVQVGETLSSISLRYGVSVGELAKTNRLGNVDHVRVGTRLKVPIPASDPRLPHQLRIRPERLRLRPKFAYWAKRNVIPVDLLEAMTWLESGWNNKRISSTGAKGIGQLMPDTVTFVSRDLVGVPLDSARIDDNIRMSARMLRYLLGQTNGDVRLALCGYYQGLRSMRMNGIYPQTKRYAADVIALRKRFRTS